MTPKFKIGDKVVSLESKAISTINEISISKSGNCYYLDTILGRFEESELPLYTEPKPKVKKYLYAFKYKKDSREVHSASFYKDDQDFLKEYKIPSFEWFQRLDWSMTEVDDND